MADDNAVRRNFHNRCTGLRRQLVSCSPHEGGGINRTYCVLFEPAVLKATRGAGGGGNESAGHNEGIQSKSLNGVAAFQT